jgi:hypothetical protein
MLLGKFRGGHSGARCSLAQGTGMLHCMLHPMIGSATGCEVVGTIYFE